MVKRVALNLFEVSRYSKPISCIKLKDGDELVSVSRCDGKDTVVITSDGYALKYNTSEIPDIGIKASGVRSIKLNAGAKVVNAFVVSEYKDYLCIFTDRNTAKRIHLDDLDKTTRAKKGSAIIKSPKSKKYTVIKAFNIGSKNIFGIIDKEIGYIKASDIGILDKSSTGTTYTKKNVDNVFVVTKYTDITNQIKEDKKEITEEQKEEEKNEKQDEKKEQQLTMSDFFEEFKI
jgi:topoisomerase-4 subunit A